MTHDCGSHRGLQLITGFTCLAHTTTYTPAAHPTAKHAKQTLPSSSGCNALIANTQYNCIIYTHSPVFVRLAMSLPDDRSGTVRADDFWSLVMQKLVWPGNHD